MQAIPGVMILIASFVGFFIAFYISHKKRTRALETLICPFHGKCEEVVTSRYSRFLGIPVEVLGMFYYGLIFASYFSATVLVFSLSSWHLLALSILSSVALLFSIYLTVVQMVALRRWCTWCLWSALMTVIIFVAGLIRL